MEENQIKTSLADKESVIIGRLPRGASKVITSLVAQKLENEGLDGSIGNMIRIWFGSLHRHLQNRLLKFKCSGKVSAEDWESFATLLPWNYDMEVTAPCMLPGCR